MNDVSFVTAASTRTIIDFLWVHYKYNIGIYLGIPYLIYFGLFLILVFFGENYSFEGWSSITENNEIGKKGGSYTVIILNFVFLSYFFYVLLRRLVYMKHRFFNNAWAVLSLISMALNVTYYVLILLNYDIVKIRRLSSFAVIIMWL